MSARQKTVSFGMVFAGLVFFFNPNIALFDLLPDVLGALLIYAGLKKAAVGGAYFDDARKVSFYMIWLYVLKTSLSLSLLHYPDNALPFTFLAGVLESLVLISFFSKLYDGFEYASMRSGDGKTATFVKDVRAMSYIFVLGRSFLAFAPEILEFMKQSEELDLSANAAYRMPIIRLKPYVLLFCVTITLVLGILYLVRIRSFFARVKKDTAMIGYLDELYHAAQKNDRPFFAGRAFGTSLIWLCAAVVFAVDFKIDSIDILPDIVGTACVFAAFLTLKGFDGKKMPRSACVCYGLICLWTTLSDAFVFSGERMTGFLASSYAVPTAILTEALYVACTVWMLAVWMKRTTSYVKAEHLGEYDSKILSVSILFSLAALTKAFYEGIAVESAHLATIPEVEKYQSARAHMNVAQLEKAILENADVARFAHLDDMLPFWNLASLVLALFAVFAVLSLRSYAARRTDPNAE